MPTRPLWPGTFLSSHSMVSKVSVLSSYGVVGVRLFPAWMAVRAGVISSNLPSLRYRPRTSWYTKMYFSPESSRLGPGPCVRYLSSPYGPAE